MRSVLNDHEIEAYMICNIKKPIDPVAPLLSTLILPGFEPHYPNTLLLRRIHPGGTVTHLISSSHAGITVLTNYSEICSFLMNPNVCKL